MYKVHYKAWCLWNYIPLLSNITDYDINLSLLQYMPSIIYIMFNQLISQFKTYQILLFFFGEGGDEMHLKIWVYFGDLKAY